MVTTRSKALKALEKAKTKGGRKASSARVTKKTNKAKPKSKSTSKKNRASKKISKKSKISKTYKNTEEKRKDLLFKLLKSFKGQNFIQLDEILCDNEHASDDYEDIDISTFEDMAKKLIQNYKDFQIDAGQLVFPQEIFESLLRKIKMAS